MILTAAFVFAEHPIVRDIQARAGSGTKVRIIWQLPKETTPEIESLILYRTTEQVTSYSQLRNVQPITALTPDRAGYTDQLSDLRDYFYTVIAQTTEGPYDVVLLSFNTTVTGVHLIAKKQTEAPAEKKDVEQIYPDGTLRKTPLPFIDMIDGIDAEPLVSDSTVSQVSSLTGGSSKTSRSPLLTPYIFEEDLVSPDGGDEYLLFEILKASFVTKKYKETIDKLNQLIGTNISDDTRNRAYFYLGESQYFCRNYEDAVRSFVKVQAAFPTVSKKWLLWIGYNTNTSLRARSAKQSIVDCRVALRAPRNDANESFVTNQ